MMGQPGWAACCCQRSGTQPEGTAVCVSAWPQCPVHAWPARVFALMMCLCLQTCTLRSHFNATPCRPACPLPFAYTLGCRAAHLRRQEQPPEGAGP